MSDEQSKGIPPGSYTRDTLPEISEGAKKILARLKSRPRAPEAERESGAFLVQKRPQPREQVVGLRPTEKLVPSLRDVAQTIRLQRLNP